MSDRMPPRPVVVLPWPRMIAAPAVAKVPNGHSHEDMARMHVARRRSSCDFKTDRCSW
jgi:hypothetical protein